MFSLLQRIETQSHENLLISPLHQLMNNFRFLRLRNFPQNNLLCKRIRFFFLHQRIWNFTTRIHFCFLFYFQIIFPSHKSEFRSCRRLRKPFSLKPILKFTSLDIRDEKGHKTFSFPFFVYYFVSLATSTLLGNLFAFVWDTKHFYYETIYIHNTFLNGNYFSMKKHFNSANFPFSNFRASHGWTLISTLFSPFQLPTSYPSASEYFSWLIY